jgi:hypothetical protein
MKDNELFKSQALIYRDKIRKIRSLLIQKQYGSRSISDYPSSVKRIENQNNNDWHDKTYKEYEERLQEIIYHTNLAIQYLREAEETRKSRN